MDKHPKAQPVLVLRTGPTAAIKFGFWSFTGAMISFGAMLTLHRLVRLGWPPLRSWLGL